MERLKLENGLKFTMSGANVFHRFTVRSVNKRSSGDEIANVNLLKTIFASDDVIPGKQTREQAIGVLSETLRYTTLQ